MSQATITLLFLLFAVIMFVWEKIPLGLTSMIVCVGLVVTGVLDWKVAFSGFIDSNVILFVSMFIVGGALFETGMANRIGYCGSYEWLPFQYRYSSHSYSGCNRYCSKIRIFEITPVDAAGICSSNGRKPFTDRSTGKHDRPVSDGRHGKIIWIF